MHTDPSSAPIDASPDVDCSLPDAAGDGRQACDRVDAMAASAGSIDDALRRHGARCVRVRGTFPPKFIVAGTADQIRRLLDEPEL